MPSPPPSNLGLEDKINSLSSRCDSPSSDQQEEFHGFTDLDVSAASERAEILRDEGDLLKHDIAEARGAYKAYYEEDVKQHAVSEGAQAVPVAKPELIKEDEKGQPAVKEGRAASKKVVNRKLPKSTTSSESGSSGKSRVSGVSKKSKDKSMLSNFKDFLQSKLKKQERKGGDEGSFHGFSDEEIRSASANDSSSERSSIISSLSREEKNERKKRKSEAAAKAAVSKTSLVVNDESNLPLLHQSLIVEGKRQKKPSIKIQELAKNRQARSKSLDCQPEKKTKQGKGAESVIEQALKDKTEEKNT